MSEAALARLEAVLDGADRCVVAPAGEGRHVVALSGGIDSLTLSAVAHRALGARVSMHHAVSPAVPPQATERCRAVAAAQGWQLTVFDAGEFADPAYRANPHDRCFFCKNSLYGTIVAHLAGQDATVMSGTNTDDLGEYRPGLQAARQHGVRHPFVEAGIDKATVRAIAPLVGLGALADLPAAPCLSSRIETGIAIEPAMLAFVNAAERLVAGRLSPRTVRCRLRGAGVVIELDEAALRRAGEAAGLMDELAALAAASGERRAIRLAAYRVGSAFLRPETV